MPVTTDNNVENDEAFVVNLGNAAAELRAVTVTDNQGQGNIIDDDTSQISISDAVVAEGYGATQLTFTVTRTNTTVPLELVYSTADGTATAAGNDYVPTSGTISLAAGGAATATITVEVIGDHVSESDETLFVNITSSSFGAVTGDVQAQGRILQDDGYVSGQKWHDINGNGIRDTDDPGLDGWVIQVLDANNNLITSGVTSSICLLYTSPSPRD